MKAALAVMRHVDGVKVERIYEYNVNYKGVQELIRDFQEREEVSSAHYLDVALRATVSSLRESQFRVGTSFGVPGKWRVMAYVPKARRH